MSKRGRKRFVAKLEAYLASEHSPRREMAFVLGTTGLFGFATTAILLRYGVVQMWIRYPAAVLVAYLVFLVLVRGLVALYQAGADPILAEYSADLGKGKKPAGGFDLPDPGGGLDIPGDEGCAIIAAIALAFGLLVVAAYFIATAPGLLAELLLDTLVVGGLCRRLRRAGEGEWFSRAIRRTIGPALFLVFILFIAGLAFVDYRSGGKVHR